MTRRIGTAVLATIAISVVGVPTAYAQAVKVATIDMRGVIEQYIGWQRRIQELNQFRLEREQQYREAVRTAYLSAEEKIEYSALSKDPAPTVERLRRLIELRDLSTQIEEELNFLSKIDDTELTEAQRQRRDELQTTYDRAKQDLDRMRQRLNKEIEDKDKALAEEADREIRDTIAAFAKENKYDLVVAKDTVIFGGKDITAEIVARLNKAASGP
jgi:Skp family chaperone for outer membrane proteins